MAGSYKNNSKNKKQNFWEFSFGFFNSEIKNLKEYLYNMAFDKVKS